MCDKSTETKLGDLMMQGWTMLADSCFGESCGCPLMRDNVTRQVYCVGCEAWVCTREKKHTGYKFNELVSLEGKRQVAKTVQGEVAVPKTTTTSSSSSLREVLERKLVALTGWLDVELDIEKCNKILDGIRKIREELKQI